MRPRDLEALELPKLLDALAVLASSTAGAETCRALRPTDCGAEVRERLTCLAEYFRLIDAQPDTPKFDVPDLRRVLALAARDGAVLEGTDLLAVLQTLRLARAAAGYLRRADQAATVLARIAARLAHPPGVEHELGRAIEDTGRIREDATPVLADLRIAIRRHREDLENRLARLLDEADREVVIEHYVTLRNDRYVVPVRASAAGRIPGVIQDRSSSGETVFLEPLFAVELNNRLVLARREEDAEERRIRARLTASIDQERDALTEVFAALVELDVLAARASLARRLDAIIPSVGDKEIRLRRARHPLLVLGERPVTPVDLILSEGCRGLVITGPNTGGKTVALKTIGLLALMAQCGLAIPADETSGLPIFARVYADIGDAQSIERDLSTFSSHMENLAGITRGVDARSLLLLDEPGVGTDPVEGTALAVSLLIYVAERGAFLAASSHAADVKTFALADRRFDVAAVDLDSTTGKPLYQLRYHTLGQSFALPLARRMGIPEPILRAAERQLSGSESPQLARAVIRLEEARQAFEAQHTAIVSERARAKEREAEYAALVSEVRQKKSQAWEVALSEARGFLSNLHTEGEKIIAELRRTRGRAGPFRKSLAAQDAAVEELVARHVIAAPTDTTRPQLGDEVEVADQGIRGELIEIRGGRAHIRRGTLRFEVPLHTLRRVTSLTTEAHGRTGGPHVRIVDVPEVDEEVSLLGLHSREAIVTLDCFLDRAVRAGRPQVRIVHGLGTGALRRAVHNFLSTSPYCARFREGSRTEGGAGVTVVELAT